MAEKAATFQGTQYGVESVAGTPVAAGKKFMAAGINLQPQLESIPFRANGNKYHSFVAPSKQWTSITIEDGPATYNEDIYLLSSLISAPTPAQQAATAAYKWTFTSSTSAEDAGKHFTIEQGDATTAWRVAGARVSGLEYTFNRNGITRSGSGFGEAIEKGITLTGSPTSITPVVILPTHCTFKMADTQAGLAGATAMTRGFAMTWRLTDKASLAWPVGTDPFVLEGAPNLTASIQLASDSVGMGMLDLLTAGSTKWFRIKCTGALIASTYYNDFQLDFPAQIEAIPGFGVADEAHTIEFTLRGVHDAAWGKSFQLDIINTLTAL